MKQHIYYRQITSAYNKAVRRAYFQILKQVKAMLSGIEQQELRFTLEREDLNLTDPGIINEFISNFIYLRLEHQDNDEYTIHWGIEAAEIRTGLSDITAAFVRLLYTQTAESKTGLHIEKCVKTDWLIKNCCEMMDYIYERNHHHVAKRLKYKPVVAKRNQTLAVLSIITDY